MYCDGVRRWRWFALQNRKTKKVYLIHERSRNLGNFLSDGRRTARTSLIENCAQRYQMRQYISDEAVSCETWWPQRQQDRQTRKNVDIDRHTLLRFSRGVAGQALRQVEWYLVFGSSFIWNDGFKPSLHSQGYERALLKDYKRCLPKDSAIVLFWSVDYDLETTLCESEIKTISRTNPLDASVCSEIQRALGRNSRWFRRSDAFGNHQSPSKFIFIWY